MIIPPAVTLEITINEINCPQGGTPEKLGSTPATALGYREKAK